MNDVSRRSLFAGSPLLGLSAVAAASLAAGPAAADEPSAAEAANIKVVKGFVATWSTKAFDPDAVTPVYFAPDAHVRVLDSLPFVVGPAAIAGAFKPYLQKGERFNVQFLQVFARGPLVVTHRIDTQVAPGQADKPMEVVGVFLVRDGKIREWTDYLIPA
jgi:limonene-1,2-epoxide hydrolase